MKPEDWRPQGVADLEPRAWDALRETQRSVLVTAGAGAGKTEFLAQKAAFLLQTGGCPPPKRILAISFKRDAARNLTERVRKRCSEDQARRFGSFTFDAFAKGLLDRFRAAIPAPYSPPKSYRIVMPNRRDYDEFLEANGFYGIGPQRLERAVSAFRLPRPSEGNDLERAVARYWETQYSEYGEVPLSFGMINRLVEFLLRSNPEIRRALQATYPIVFLDEFQDTTGAQFDLLRRAFEGSHAVFTAVGDDKQRIMLWAGALRDAFARFEEQFAAVRVSLLSNWRSHEDLVRIQHAIARRIDAGVEYPEARGTREVDGEIAAIWEFRDGEQQAEALASWVGSEVGGGSVSPHDVAILVRLRADDVEEELAPAFLRQGLRLRNVARLVGQISIQDLLGEDLTGVVLPLLRLGTTWRSPADWSRSLENLRYLEAVDPADDLGQEDLRRRLQSFVRDLRRTMRETESIPDQAMAMTDLVLEFVDAGVMRQAFPGYQREQDFERVRDGFVALLEECLEGAETWARALDDFEGIGQVVLMTIHKSKGLEFHTMVFYGLDNQTWWSLTPDRDEELNAFFVAFTRAKQRAFFTLCSERGAPVTWIENLLEPVGVRRVDGLTALASGEGEAAAP